MLALAALVMVFGLPLAGRPSDAYQVGTAFNLNLYDSTLTLINNGTQGGNICANVYALAPDTEEISCCSCLVAPDALQSLSVITNFLDGIPTSVNLNVIASTPTGGTCNPATVTATSLATGLRSFIQPAGGSSTALQDMTLTPTELTTLAEECAIELPSPRCKSCPTSGTALNSYQLHTASHLDIGDSVVNITNDGQSSIIGDGNFCVGVYTFDANEELQSCCSCLVTPNGLDSLSAQAINATSLTGENATSLVVKLLAWSTTAGASSTAPPGTPAPPTSSACNAATPGTLAGGMHAWGTTLHELPSGGPSTYTVTETEFSPASLSAAEYAYITQSCEFNQINGSAQSGQCKGCASGGQ